METKRKDYEEVKSFKVEFEHERSDFFQGAGVCGSGWDKVFLGVGITQWDAFEDAIEHGIQDGVFLHQFENPYDDLVPAEDGFLWHAILWVETEKEK